MKYLLIIFLLYLFPISGATQGAAIFNEDVLGNLDKTLDQQQRQQQMLLQYQLQLRQQQMQQQQYNHYQQELANNEKQRQTQECIAQTWQTYASISHYRTLNDGEYTAFWVGKGGCIQVSVKVKDEIITSISIDKNTVSCSLPIIDQKAHWCANNGSCTDFIIF